MQTISYEYEGALYVNLTNRCDCSCVFCLRHNGHKGSIYADDLWLEHEPSREEALEDLLARELTKYRELVFCGFGEPMYRTGGYRLAGGRAEKAGERSAPRTDQHQRSCQPDPGTGRDAAAPGAH